ncbi:MAG TPA: ABC transporter six-transmembrane domain-containing protein [Ferruginibacter sp.]|nr:ABC transporter six-transmembrane domain-containing protein [Ferruginibacter sp.]
MSRFEILKKLMLQHRWRLLVTYVLFSLEMLGSLMRPFFLGMAVNDLVKGSYHGLIMLSVVHLSWLLIGTVRHMYDTRTYSAIYTSLVTRFLSRRYGKADVSRLSAHSTLSREFVDFLEYDLVYIMEALYNLLGSLVLLYFYDRSVVAICFAILLPVMLVSYFYGRKMRTLTRLKNDELEKQVGIISGGNKDAIQNHYNALRKWQVKISDKEAFNFGMIEIMVLLVIGASLLISTNMFGTTMLAGNLIGMYNYILKFVSGLDTIPYTVQRITTLSDITRRIELHDDDLSSMPEINTPVHKNVHQQLSLKLSA